MYSTYDVYRSFDTEREGYNENWILLQYDSRPLSDMDKEGCRRNEAYCNKHGYTYRLIQSDDKELPPYWKKVKLVQDILQNESCKGVFWVDTDAAVMNHSITLDELCPTDRDMVFSPDSPIWALVSPFNAGVWLIRNTPEGKSIMKQWMDKYDPTQWTKNGDSWTSLGIWAGSTYEQGAFSELLPRIQHMVHIVDWRVLQDVSVTPKTFTLHFSNHQKSLREAVFTAF